MMVLLRPSRCLPLRKGSLGHLVLSPWPRVIGGNDGRDHDSHYRLRGGKPQGGQWRQLRSSSVLPVPFLLDTQQCLDSRQLWE